MSELYDPNLLTKLRANVEEMSLFGVPYSLREYHAPGVGRCFWDATGYPEETHEKNLLLLEKVVDIHGGENEKTPWLSSGIGLAIISHGHKKFDFTSVSLADDRMAHRLGLHFVRQDVAVHLEKGIKARTRIYQTVSKLISNFTTSDAAWALSYPSLHRNPEAASKHMNEWLIAPHELEPATPESLINIFPLRPFALRHWVGVKLDQNRSKTGTN